VLFLSILFHLPRDAFTVIMAHRFTIAIPLAVLMLAVMRP